MARVQPSVVTRGGRYIEVSSGQRVYPEGVGTQIDDNVGNTKLQQWLDMVPSTSVVTLRVTWDTYEPDRPTGGNPALGGGHGETHTWDPTLDATLTTLMDLCQARGKMFVVRTGHTGGAGIDFVGGSAGQPGWLVDDWYWDGLAHGRGSSHSVADLPGGVGALAPLPRDRAGYGGPYYSADQPTTSKAEFNQIQENIDSAWWMPYAGDSGLVNVGHTTMTSNAVAASAPYAGITAKTWRGDAEYVMSYLMPFLQRLVEVSQGYSMCIGYNFFNEPDIGGLNDAGQFNTGSNHRVPVERLIRTQTLYYDQLRVIEPDRFFTMHGEGGHNWTATPDFSIYWTGGVGGGGACPDNIHLVYEFHAYMSGQDGLTTSVSGQYDTSGPLFNQRSLAQLPPLTHEVALSGFDTNGDSFRLRWNGLQALTHGSFVRGTNATAAAIQTALNALPIYRPTPTTGYPIPGPGLGHDVPVTVTGTTDAGPFDILFPNTADGNDAALEIVVIYGVSGCTGEIDLIGGGVSGDLNNQQVYTPVGTYIKDTFHQIHDAFAARNCAVFVGEYGIDISVIDGPNYFDSLFAALRETLDASAVFVMNAGGHDSVLTDQGGGVYALNSLGTRLKQNLDIGVGSMALSIVGSTSTSTQLDTASLDLPAGTQDGDHVILLVAARSSGDTAGFTFGAPPGYSPLGVGTPPGHDHDRQFLTAAVFIKKLTQTEAATGNVTGMGTAENILACTVVRGAQAVDSVSIDASPNTSSTTPIAPTITPTVDGSMLVWVGAQSQASTVVTEVTGYTQQLHDREAVLNANLCVHIATNTQAVAGATGAQSLVLSGSGRWVASLISLTPVGSSSGGGGQSSIVDVGIGEGHIDTQFGTTKQQAAANAAVMVGGAGAMLRCDLSRDSIVKGDTFPNSYWTGLTGRNGLCTADGAAGARYFGTLHTGRTQPPPPTTMIAGVQRMPEWQAYCTGACDRYSPRTSAGGVTAFTAPGWDPITRWEILNEPNGYSGGFMPAPTAYLMLREASDAIRAHAAANGWADQCHLTGPALAGIFDPITYLNNLQAAAIADGRSLDQILDRVCVHVYMAKFPTAVAKPGTVRVDELGDLTAFHQALNALGLTSMEVALSEGGYSGDDTHNQWTGGAGDMVYATRAAIAALPASQRSGKFTQGQGLVATVQIIQQQNQLGNWRVTLFTPYKTLRTGVSYTGVTGNGSDFWYDNLALCDYHGNSSPTLREAGVDFSQALANANSAPIGGITSPASGTSVNTTTLTLTASYTDADGIQSAEYRVNAGSWLPMTVLLDHANGTVDYTATATVTLSGGAGTANTIDTRATDNSASHLVSSNSTIVVQGISPAVDVTPPTLTVSAPASSLSMVGDPGTVYIVSGQATDTNGCQVTVNGLQAQLDAAGNFTFPVILSIGSNPVLVQATDPYNNQSAINRTITLQQTAGGGGDTVVVSTDLGDIHIRVIERGIG